MTGSIVKCFIWGFLGAAAGTKAVIDGVNMAKEKKASKEAKKKQLNNSNGSKTK